MKKILVPTDFSKNSEAALKYACGFAGKFDMEIVIFHVYGGNEGVQFLPAVSDKKKFREENKMAGEAMSCWSSKIMKTKKVPFSAICYYGMVPESILDGIERIKPRYVFMGTRGAGKTGKKYFGSNTIAVLRNSVYPVLSVPESRTWKTPKTISYATDYNKTDFHILKEIAELARKVNAHLTLLHISDYELKEEVEIKNMELFIERVKKKTGYKKISGHLLYGTNAAERLKKYVQKSETDLLVMAKEERGVLGRVFHRSVAEELTHFAQMPVMVFHSHEDPVTWF